MKEGFSRFREGVKEGVKSRARALIPVAIDIQGLMGSLFLETVRSSAVNPRNNAVLVPPSQLQTQPGLDQTLHPALFEVLSHGGNAYEGYLYSFAIYNAFTMLSPRIPERVRKYSAAGIGIGVIAAYELGYIVDKAPDPPDIPAGAIGAIAFLGLHTLGKRFIDRRMSEIEQMNS